MCFIEYEQTPALCHFLSETLISVLRVPFGGKENQMGLYHKQGWLLGNPEGFIQVLSQEKKKESKMVSLRSLLVSNSASVGTTVTLGKSPHLYLRSLIWATVMVSLPEGLFV